MRLPGASGAPFIGASGGPGNSALAVVCSRPWRSSISLLRESIIRPCQRRLILATAQSGQPRGLESMQNREYFGIKLMRNRPPRPIDQADQNRIIAALERLPDKEGLLGYRTRAFVYLLWDGALRTGAAL